MKRPNIVEELRFPVLLWRKGYSYVANDALELCTHPRSLFAETQRRARAGEFRIADSEGRIYEVRDYEPTAAFGGLKRLGHILLRSIFAAPVCSLAEQSEPTAFRATVAKVVLGRFGKGFAKQLEATESPREVLKLVAERERKAG